VFHDILYNWKTLLLNQEVTDIMDEQNKAPLEEEKNDETEDENVEETSIENDDEVSEEADLTSKITELETEKEEIYEKMLRLQADFENFKRRAKKDRENDLKYKSQDLANEIIPILDNFERALQFEIDDDQMKSFVDGMKMIHDQLLNALKQVGVEEIKAENEMFDPQVHQAVMQVQEEGFESNQIVEVLQKGYVLKDRVLRPSMVKVNE